MTKHAIYTVEAADGFYIACNGEPVLDFVDPQDYDFAHRVCAALNQAEKLYSPKTHGNKKPTQFCVCAEGLFAVNPDGKCAGCKLPRGSKEQN